MTALVVNVSMAFDGSTWKTPIETITWTNVTSYVLHQDGVSITRGRSTGRDEVRAGTCSFTLQDFDRRFDPENTAGPYYGFLNPGVPVRVRVSVGGIPLAWDGDLILWDDEQLEIDSDPYPRFFGFVEDFPQGSQDPADRRVLIPIEATDAFGMLALGRQPGVMQTAVLALDPVGYWPLTESDGAVSVIDITGNNNGTPFDSPAFGQDPLARGLGPSVEFDGVNDRIDLSRSPLVQDMYHCTIMAVFSTDVPAEAASIHPIFAQADGGGPGNNDAISLYVDEDGLVAWDYTISGLGFSFESSGVVDDGSPHLVIAQSNFGFGVDFGVAVDSATLSTTSHAAAFNSGNGASIGGSPFVARDFTDNAFEGRIGHVAIFGVLDSTDRQTLVDAYAGLSGQTTDERIDYILDQAGFPAADRALTTGYTTLGPADHEGQFTLDLLRRVEKTEQGRFFIAKDGTATFHARYHGQLVATSSSATFSDDGSDVRYSRVEVVRPRQFIYNKVTVTTDGLSPLTVDDATSIDTHGEREDSVDAPLFQSSQPQRSLAEYVLANSKDPHPRLMGMSVPIHKNLATLAPLVLPLEQGSRVTFERTPVGAGAPIVLDQILEGYTERFDTKTYTWTPHLSPAEPVTFAVWGGSGDEDEWGSGIWGY